jgi:diguanylate cyclase (GGDEF)-like protein
MRDNIRTIDSIGRYGGEEFVILLPNTALPGSREIAERICEIIGSQYLPAGDEAFSVTASLGVTSLEDTGGISVEVLLDRADQALYAAKQAGRNRVEVWKEP